MKFNVSPEAESNLPTLRKLEETIRNLFSGSVPVSNRDIALAAWYFLVPEAREAAAQIAEEWGNTWLDHERAAEQIAADIRKGG